ncbi:MAG TPA: YoaK family protein [Candidatus Limnocylindria bacterium]
MTLVTGLVDAASYLGLGHVFAANMTGTIVLLGFSVAGVTELSPSLLLVALVAFVAGAIAGGRLAASTARRVRRWVFAAALLESVLLAAAALVALGPDPERRAPSLVVALAALAMGIRNATVRRLGVPDMTTTVLTLTITGVAADSRLAGGSDPRLLRRLAAIAAMFVGAAIGAILLRFGVAAPLFAAAAVVLTSGVMWLLHSQASGSTFG